MCFIVFGYNESQTLRKPWNSYDCKWCLNPMITNPTNVPGFEQDDEKPYEFICFLEGRVTGQENKRETAKWIHTTT